MTKHKSKFLYFAGAICLLSGLFAGCGATDLFNDQFLNQFFPDLGGSLSTIRGKGPLTIVLENLTIEARHQEYATMGISYIDSTGAPQSVSRRTLLAVPEEDRNPASADFDPRYREIIILDCGIQEIWFSGTVYRTTIEEKDETVTLGNEESVQINFATASVVKSQDEEGEFEFFTQDFSNFSAVQIPTAHLQVTRHYKCGDVIVVGLLDQRGPNRAIVPQVYESDYVDANSIPGEFGPTERFVPDVNNSRLRQEYRYPVGYVVIPLVMPNLTGVYSATSAMIDIAAANAEGVTD
ncbi:MAG: hypothetical protein GX629_12300 [Phycisphaerae bacterium]|jgi:hypothetical protein|nr:hypothetical protein [Phycisphaerae bacterium]